MEILYLTCGLKPGVTEQEVENAIRYLLLQPGITGAIGEQTDQDLKLTVEIDGDKKAIQQMIITYLKTGNF